MRVLVLGGTGVISSQIVKRLMNDKHEVTVFNRGQSATPDGISVILGDKKDKGAFAGHFTNKKYDTVIDMISFNPDDARLTLETFRHAADQIIVCSTVAAYKRPYDNQPVQPDNPLWDDPIFAYGYWKAEMERYLQSEMKQGAPVTIIRPSLTYGIGAKNIGVMRNNYGIIDRLQQKKPFIVNGDGTNPWCWTFAPDLAKAFAGAVGKQKCIGQYYHATSDDARIWDDQYQVFGKLIGETPTIYHLPSEMLIKVDKDLFGHLYYEKTYCGLFDNSKIKADVPEFQCEYTLETGLKMIYDWYMRDETMRVIDPAKVQLEDKLCDFYLRMASEIQKL